jgi:hypothetical protein
MNQDLYYKLFKVIVWHVFSGICLYQQAAIFCIDKSNELHLQVKDGKVFVYLINTSTKYDILPDIAATVQECLTLTMTKVLEFYHKSF